MKMLSFEVSLHNIELGSRMCASYIKTGIEAYKIISKQNEQEHFRKKKSQHSLISLTHLFPLSCDFHFCPTVLSNIEIHSSDGGVTIQSNVC
jgi:hypothetical protein